MTEEIAGGCLFCKIASGEIPADVVARNSKAMAFRDIDPKSPTHVLVIPLEHYENVTNMTESDQALAGAVLALAGEVALQEGLADGYRLVFNTGVDGGQSVYHVHAHVMGGRKMLWPPG
jgi:histidine triad (HIT) family protein